jgi:hypothetical protein
MTIAQTSTAALNVAIQMKIACQPKLVTSTPPRAGATIGATTIAVVMRPSIAAERSRSNRSRMIARPITMPADAPTACSMRAAISSVIELAAMAATDAPTLSARPASSTGRRPKRSESGPSSSCAPARLSR